MVISNTPYDTLLTPCQMPSLVLTVNLQNRIGDKNPGKQFFGRIGFHGVLYNFCSFCIFCFALVCYRVAMGDRVHFSIMSVRQSVNPSDYTSMSGRLFILQKLLVQFHPSITGTISNILLVLEHI
jgi:hypothetical protein